MLNKETFIKNLSEITKGMKQKEIASIMGCSEGTMSKYLNADKKEFPAAEMLYNLSQHFHVSIDWLIGATQKQVLQTDKKLSARDVCQMIVQIDKAIPFGFEIITKTEYCGEVTLGYPQNAIYNEKENSYLSIYFTNWQVTDNWDIWELDQGNGRYEAIQINLFLSRYQKIRSMLDEGNLDEEMYDILLNKYLADVSDKTP